MFILALVNTNVFVYKCQDEHEAAAIIAVRVRLDVELGRAEQRAHMLRVNLEITACAIKTSSQSAL